MNAVTGANVTVLIMGMSAFMVVHGNKALKNCGKEVFMDGYKPYNNTLTHSEQERLKIIYDKAEEGR